jgi:NADH-quinone oxidoreductase subunit E
VNPARIFEIVDRYKGKEGDLIAILEDIQARFNHLPPDALRIVAKRTGRSLTDIYGVATFYQGFSLKPRGRHLVSVCMGTACHVRRASMVRDELVRKLDVEVGETTEDKEFTLEEVKCVGACALGPIVVVDGDYYSNVEARDAKKIIRKHSGFIRDRPLTDDERIFSIKVACPRCNHSLMDHKHKIDDRPSIRVLCSSGDKHGWLRLSSLYGSFNSVSEHEIPEDTISHFFCHRCHAELRSTQDCTRCAAPMVSLLVKGGGVVHICSRQGCKEHMLHLTADNVE